MDAIVFCWHGWRGLSRNDQALHSGMSREVERGRFHPAPWNGAGLSAPFVKGAFLQSRKVWRRGNLLTPFPWFAILNL